MAIVDTFSECFLVEGSRASIAEASALIVCVNILRMSTTDWYAARVVYSGRANNAATRYQTLRKARTISHAIGTRPTRLSPNERRFATKTLVTRRS